MNKYGMQMLSADSDGGDVKATMNALTHAVVRLYLATKVVEVGGMELPKAEAEVGR